MRNRLIGLLLVLTAGCSVPSGSLARPTSPGVAGDTYIGGGVMVPFYYNAKGDDFRDGSGELPKRVVVPTASFDTWINEKDLGGFEVGAAHLGNDNRLINVNGRYERRLENYLALTADIGFSATFGGPRGRQLYLHPRIGLRGYLPTGWGGLVLSQQLGGSPTSINFSGSVAFDAPIPLSEQVTLHIFPELRWDPTFLFGDARGERLVFVSGGLSFLVSY